MATKRGNPNLKKGVSGNPGGRPKKTQEQYDLEAACRNKTPAALDVICHVMEKGVSEANRLKAAQYIIDRGHGKAPETVNMKAELSEKKELSGDELKAELAKKGLPVDIFEE